MRLSISPTTLCAVALAALAAAGCKGEQTAPARAAPPVQVMTVAPGTIPYVNTFVAQTESSRQVEIVARVSGYLDRIAYQEGELVKEGQVLFQLDPKPLQAQLDAARGELQSQQARFATAQANLRRIAPLAEMNAVSRADLDRAQGDHDSARAAVFAAQAKVKSAEINLGYTTIRSPVTGLASRSQQRQGAFVNAMSDTARLTYVAALDPAWVNFSVSQNQTARLRELVQAGQVVLPKSNDFEVELVLPDGTVYPQRGRINFADPSFSQDTGSFLVRAVVPNPDRQLRPGMFVTARVLGAVRPDAIVVPQLAVQQGPNGHLVYVVKPDGTAEIRPVVVGDYVDGKDIVVTQGLKAGDRVVTEGVLKVVPGKPVQVGGAAPAAGAQADGARAAEPAGGAK